MSNEKMLIDATHPEETRVVVLRQGRVEEFDYESASRKLLRGNIYLAKVTRVEPSLQAAFVEYGGNRHGFLAFNEIHPDYYQIPVADRQALLDEEAAAEAEEEAAVDAHAEELARRSEEQGSGEPDEGGYDPGSSEQPGDPEAAMPAALAPHADDRISDAPADAGGSGSPEMADGHPHEAADAGEADSSGGVEEVGSTGNGADAESVEQVGNEDALEELASRPRRRARSYKIQEVIKRRQILLVQVVKEERGNKGAALTTYLSLAGRYTVLMPNTARGGGISRKITNPQDRRRLKSVATELEVPEGMGLIIRTAGAARTKQEVKRDFEYLLRLWESVREMTLTSSAPNLVYEEGNLIKRSIRDLYNKDVEEIVVAGEAAHHEARDFMRMLMPSHAKNVVHYAEPEPLFTRFQIERQLNAMFSPYVTLRSGGYLVINQTEALVAIDVNSGKSTREFSIEETALATNLEAADEIARQLKLRDLAGLVVIDFIDMEEKRNNRAVERRVKDALRFDRARIQVGRISHFGLMEMSRQRLRTGVLEGSTSQCAHCQGTGIIRSTESVALAVLRGIEDALMAGADTPLVVTTTAMVALYILNNKRSFVIDMEARHGLPITVQGSEKMQGANFVIEAGARLEQPRRRTERSAVNMDWGFDGEAEGEPEEQSERAAAQEGLDEAPGSETDHPQRGRRRRGRRGGKFDAPGLREDGPETDSDRPVLAGAAAGDDWDGRPADGETIAGPPRSGDGVDGEARRGRRRGRRGGRRGRERSGFEQTGGELTELAVENRASEYETGPENMAASPEPFNAADVPSPDEGVNAALADVSAVDDVSGTRANGGQVRPRREPKASEPRLERVVVGADSALPVESESKPEQPIRKGWWQRRLAGE